MIFLRRWVGLTRRATQQDLFVQGELIEKYSTQWDNDDEDGDGEDNDGGDLLIQGELTSTTTSVSR